jgi:hypothetical protein
LSDSEFKVDALLNDCEVFKKTADNLQKAQGLELVVAEELKGERERLVGTVTNLELTLSSKATELQFCEVKLIADKVEMDRMIQELTSLKIQMVMSAEEKTVEFDNLDKKLAEALKSKSETEKDLLENVRVHELKKEDFNLHEKFEHERFNTLQVSFGLLQEKLNTQESSQVIEVEDYGRVVKQHEEDSLILLEKMKILEDNDLINVSAMEAMRTHVESLNEDLKKAQFNLSEEISKHSLLSQELDSSQMQVVSLSSSVEKDKENSKVVASKFIERIKTLNAKFTAFEADLLAAKAAEQEYSTELQIQTEESDR